MKHYRYETNLNLNLKTYTLSTAVNERARHCTFSVHYSNTSLDGAALGWIRPRASSETRTCSRAWRAMCSAERGCCCGCRSLQPAPCSLTGSSAWLTGACSAAIDCTWSRGRGSVFPTVIQVVWTHGGVPVMVWPAAKLFKSDWSQELTAQSHWLTCLSVSLSVSGADSR